MGNELVPKKVTEGALSNQSFDDVVASTGYLQRLQLFGGKSDACTEGKIGIGHWGLVDDGNIVDVGEEVDIVLITWRPKALEIGGDSIISEYDSTTELFMDIAKRSGIKDSGCMYGPEYLVWVPSVSKFATLYMCSKTARREAKKMHGLLGQAVTLQVHVIDNGKFKWHGPRAVPCSTPVEMADSESLTVEVDKFNNPPKNETELADDGEDDRG